MAEQDTAEPVDLIDVAALIDIKLEAYGTITNPPTDDTDPED